LIDHDKLHCFQPAFTLADSNRCIQSKRLLYATIEDTRKAELRLIQSQERYSVVDREIQQLLAKVQALSAEIEQKQSVLKVANDEVDEMSLRIKFNLEKKNGLCIR
jgi:uncharacterized protein YoxC